MNVLQAAERVGRRRELEHFLELVVPGGRYVGGRQIAAQQGLFQLEAENDVQVVGRLVRLDADEGGLHVIDREIEIVEADVAERVGEEDRKSTRLNSSHSQISYAVFCLKK